jgi:GDP-D-mannose dehydratase
MESELQACRICKSVHLTQVVDLGRQVITSRFPDIGDTTTPATKVRLQMCDNCSLVQLRDTTDCSELYEHMYGYRSGLNEMMRKHLADYNAELTRYAQVGAGDYVLDIGSNDATFLKNYGSDVHRIGCDPTGSQFVEYYDGIELVPTYFTQKNIQDRFGPDLRFSAVSSISMFYDLPDPVQFAKDIHALLTNDGVWTLEQSYVATMLERNSIDTICHEHLEYYGVKQIKEIMDRAGFKIIHISLNECNGGSFRCYVVKKTSSRASEATDLIHHFLEQEAKAGIHTPTRYVQFNDDCTREINKLRAFIQAVNHDGKKVYIYGASTKGNCLLQAGNITPDLVPYAVERNSLKFGKMTSTQIPIISESQMRSENPEFLLVLPWHFREGIIQREHAYLESGGQLIFPFPHFEVYSQKKRALVTGCNGQIAHPLIEKLRAEYTVYGLTQHLSTDAHDYLQLQYDASSLESQIVTLNPSVIVHLASITLTEDCEQNPLKTLDSNGALAGRICDIIYRNKLNCKLFNASSSELYKGHVTYTIQEDDHDMYPVSAYAIAKAFSHNIVDYYRKKYNLPFSNGVVFTTESRYRKPHFLLRKVADHAKQWRTSHSVLQLGSLDSYRNIVHASDVADAIVLILAQPTGANYNICGDESVKVEYLVKTIYALHGIELVQTGACYVDSASGLPVIHTGNHFRAEVSNITGVNTYLRALGWSPRSVHDTLRDFLEPM